MLFRETEHVVLCHDTNDMGVVKCIVGKCFACISNIKKLRDMLWLLLYSIWQLNQRTRTLWKDLLSDPNVLCGQVSETHGLNVRFWK